MSDASQNKFPAEIRKFVAPEIVFGLNALELSGQYAANLGARKVLLVSDPGVEASGWTGKVVDSIANEGLPLVVYSGVSPNPRDTEVMEGAELYHREGCDVIVAIGGGSPMDCAKGIGIVAVAGGHILDYEGVDQVELPIPPLICLPTTAGSSADVSQFCIISDQNRKVKIAIVSKTMVPDVALIDPLTITSMDAHLTACTGLDALTHAIEAYVSTANSPLTDLYALEAIRLLSNHLLGSIVDQDNLELRTQVMLASMDAGLAFSNAILGAVHAMAHSLGGFLDLPHGECNAILLEHVIAYNFQSVPERYRDVAMAMGLPAKDLSHGQLLDCLLEGIRQMRIKAGITRKLSDLGVSKADLSELSAKACGDACLLTNPRQAAAVEIEEIYGEAL